MSTFTLTDKKGFNHANLIRYLKKAQGTWTDIINDYSDKATISFDAKDDLTMNFAQIVKFMMLSFKSFEALQDDGSLFNQMKQILPSEVNELISGQLETLKTENQDLNTQVNQLIMGKTKLEQMSKTIETVLRETQESTQKNVEEKEMLKAKINSLKSTMIRSSVSNEESDVRIQDLVRNNANLLDKIEQQKKEIDSLNYKIEDLRELNESLKHDRANSKSNLASKLDQIMVSSSDGQRQKQMELKKEKVLVQERMIMEQRMMEEERKLQQEMMRKKKEMMERKMMEMEMMKEKEMAEREMAQRVEREMAENQREMMDREMAQRAKREMMMRKEEEMYQMQRMEQEKMEKQRMELERMDQEQMAMVRMMEEKKKQAEMLAFKKASEISLISLGGSNSKSDSSKDKLLIEELKAEVNNLNDQLEQKNQIIYQLKQEIHRLNEQYCEVNYCLSQSSEQKAELQKTIEEYSKEFLEQRKLLEDTMFKLMQARQAQ